MNIEISVVKENDETINAIRKEFERLRTFSGSWEFNGRKMFWNSSFGNTEMFAILGGIQYAISDLAYFSFGGGQFSLELCAYSTCSTWQDVLNKLKEINEVKFNEN
jgi:hypothetical protein